MKIVKLQAENVKRLKAVTIEPHGNTVVISGKNGQGKTSVLDCIWYALGGGQAAKDTTRPIRDGQKSASVVLDLGEYIVTRTWTANDKTYLKVESREGAKFPSPQAMLDNLVGKLSFDPLAFAQMDEHGQMDALLGVVKLEEDPAALDAQRQELYNQRTLINRDVKQLEGQLAGMPALPADLPTAEVSAASVMAEIENANGQIRANDAKRGELKTAERSAEAAQFSAADLAEQMAEAEKRLIVLRETHERATRILLDARSTVNRLVAECDALLDPDLSAYRQRLADVEQTNTAIRAARERAQVSAKLAEVKTQSEELSQQIANIDTRKTEVIHKAQFPIDGLAFDAAGVTYNDIPFKQCSAAEKLRVSMAMAMALNPKVRVIRITDGSLLDTDNMRVIDEMAKANDFQCWIERVDESGKVGIYIEDGAVRSLFSDEDGVKA